MELPDKEVAGGSGGHAETIAEEKESGVNPIHQRICCGVGEFSPVLAKIRAVQVHQGEAIKPDNVCLRYLEGVRATTESVGHLILATRSMS